MEGITADNTRNVYITAWAGSTDFPTTAGAYDITYGGGTYDIYLAKLSSDGSSLHFSTNIGGSANDTGNSISLDGSGNGGNYYVYATKFSSDGSTLLYSTYLGGSSFDYVIDLDINASGNAYLAGFTSSAAFPTTIDGNDRFMTGVNDGFFSVLNPRATNLTYSTFIGGTGQDRSRSVVWNAATGSAYVGGQNEFTDGPTTPAPTLFGPMGGGKDAFVVKFWVTDVCGAKAPALSNN